MNECCLGALRIHRRCVVPVNLSKEASAPEPVTLAAEWEVVTRPPMGLGPHGATGGWQTRLLGSLGSFAWGGGRSWTNQTCSLYRFLANDQHRCLLYCVVLQSLVRPLIQGMRTKVRSLIAFNLDFWICFLLLSFVRFWSYFFWRFDCIHRIYLIKHYFHHLHGRIITHGPRRKRSLSMTSQATTRLLFVFPPIFFWSLNYARSLIFVVVFRRFRYFHTRFLQHINFQISMAA